MTQRTIANLKLQIARTVYPNTKGEVTASALAALLNDILDSVQLTAESRSPPLPLTVTATDTIAPLSAPLAIGLAWAISVNGVLYFPPAFTIGTDRVTITWDSVSAGTTDSPTHLNVGDAAPLLLAF